MANSKICEKCGYSNPVYSSKCIKCQNALPKEERKIEVNTASEPKDIPYQEEDRVDYNQESGIPEIIIAKDNEGDKNSTPAPVNVAPNYEQSNHATTSNSSNKIAGGIISVVVFLLIFGYFTMGEKIFSHFDKSNMTLKEFDSIQIGMTAPEVANIVGSNGVISSTSTTDIPELNIYHKIEIRSYEGAGSVGANALITFENGKVTMKVQAGLK